VPPSVIFYISGHGFGHAIRQIAIINALHAFAPALPIVVRTAAPEWLFTRTTCGASVFLAGETDTGVVQIDSLRPDVAETVRQARAFVGRFDELVAREAALIRASCGRLVISDAPPLGCAAAAAAGVPAVVCSNFTWDWIYREYSEQPGVESLVAEIGRVYSTASAGWRLPLSGGFETIDPIIDLPFVARHQARGRPASRPSARTGLLRWLRPAPVAPHTARLPHRVGHRPDDTRVSDHGGAPRCARRDGRRTVRAGLSI
jgi:L-arabinokinase